ncbi:glideosome associated protein with multiple membrane spans 1 [Plasmodium reichenowi]|uniref:Glideosome associated protein with multiple membrane spans 1 n=1 Tax=Plasmodium reichenowi TaxID=5854 RepID=A0A060RXB2_PLARE|nr:glideosome associated protein with multiple membrane spans 1 [Plasmodium reichenowi]KYN94678.1 glideosome associated protein with multiple membrane spans 1 [Plasmodium reichenowi]CDO66031.1 glideosome associated protein with multiple membrane spans 1 [Plasmodium reichenowi]SOV81876.1 glideosome associated protein with multiple membrane spans 1 [Plasmodium reichenowi]
MFFTYVVRPGEAPEGRGPQFEPFWDFFMNFNLRVGFLIQFISYILLVGAITIIGKNPLGILNFLRALPGSVGTAPMPLVLFSIGGFLMGTLLIMSFLQLTEDDSSIKQSRGYRAGTKFLLQATSMGTVSWSLSLICLMASSYYFDDPWMEEKIGAGSSWILYFSSRLIDAFCLFLYGSGCFFLEVYHSEGAGEAWGWLCGMCFIATSFVEVLALTLFNTPLFSSLDWFYCLFLGLSLFFSVIWGLLFEPISHRYDVKLTQSAMRNEYYKSRNAMAYYGPAVVTANGELDIEASTENIAACKQC